MARPQATPRALAVARGDEPADTLITGGRVFADATREWVDTSLALADGVIAGWGEREAAEVIDVDGAALTPGFVDAHMHLESTKLWIDEFVATVLPAGTTAVAADPHELANVLGVPGILALMEAAAPLPFTFAVYASSCVPASPFESAGATLDATDIAELITRHGARGVAEVMNFPGVIAGDEEMLARVAVAGGLRVDGHSPGVSGRLLDAYLAAGVESDHESTVLAEAEEKRRKGMWVFLRQGSASQNLVDLAPSIVAHGTDQAAFCTDDREPDTLRRLGHVNDCARLAVASGISEIGGDPAGQHQPGPLSRLRRARQPRARPPGRHPRLLLARDLAARPGVAARAGRRDRRRAGARRGSGRPRPRPAARHGQHRGTARRRRARAARAAGEPRARDRGREPQPHHAARRARGRARRRPGPRRRRRAPPRHRAGRARIRHGLRTAARRDRLDGRPRRPQSRRRRPLRRGHAQRRRPAGRDRRRPGGGARRRRPGRGAAPARRADERRAGGARRRPRSRRSTAPPRSGWAPRWPSRSCSCRSSRSR